jgi:diaminopimelate epimerase
MKDVSGITRYETLSCVQVPSKGSFLDTGTRHYVRFVEAVDEYDIVSEGGEIRYNAPELQPIGANVNFVQPSSGVLKVRTYEKGVEDETFACGTGIVASCIAAFAKGKTPSWAEGGRVRYDVMAKKDSLSVDFIPAAEEIFPVREVYLTGPAVFVAEIILPEM